jgi:hypothetical protein
VKELQQRGAERAEVTVASLIADLDEDRKLARGAGQASAAVSATMAKAKLLGLVIDRKEVGAPGEFDQIENMSADELRAFIRQFTEAISGGDDAAAAGGEARPPRASLIDFVKSHGRRPRLPEPLQWRATWAVCESVLSEVPEPGERKLGVANCVLDILVGSRGSPRVTLLSTPRTLGVT